MHTLGTKPHSARRPKVIPIPSLVNLAFMPSIYKSQVVENTLVYLVIHRKASALIITTKDIYNR